MTVNKWRCKVCGYIHEGPEPPEVCPVCGAPRSEFEPFSRDDGVESKALAPAAQPVVPLSPGLDGLNAALGTISYGLFVVSSIKDGKINAQTANTVFQITSKPARLALGINKNNLTHEYIQASGVLAVTILGRGNIGIVKRFGFQSGRTTDKFAGLDCQKSPVIGCPVIPGGLAYLEAQLVPNMSLDVGTHTLFVADVVGGGTLRSLVPMTYDFYRQNRAKPEAMIDNVDLQNTIAALNLEYGARQRYEKQIEDLRFSRLNALLEGVMRSEADHVDNNLAYITKSMPNSVTGMDMALLHLKLNLEFEEIARDTYKRFASQTDDPGLKEMFLDQSWSELGHVNIFKTLIEDIEGGNFPYIFYCPLCGWEVDFGQRPSEGSQSTCAKCGAKVRLELKDGNWQAVK